MRAWYCAQTEPNCEYRAKKYLELDGIPAFLPTYLTKDKSRHLKVNLLIRGYIFFSLDDPVLWPRIRTVSGILKVITNITVQFEDTLWYSMPSLCGSQAIENLRKLCLSMDEFRRDGGGRTKTLNYITAGVHVRMRAGTVNPFQDLIDIQKPIVEWADEQRAFLPIMMFGREHQIEFFTKDLELV